MRGNITPSSFCPVVPCEKRNVKTVVPDQLTDPSNYKKLNLNGKKSVGGGGGGTKNFRKFLGGTKNF
jgi:hypothetical protein